MTAQTIRLNGQTTALTLTASASSATLIKPSVNCQNSYVSLLNIGGGKAAIELSQSSSLADPTIASSGTAGSFVLPPNMINPILVACPQNNFYIKAIGDSTGSTLFITPAAFA